MSVIVCMDPLTHKGCAHDGWQQVSLRLNNPAHLAVLEAARTAATYASRDLGLDTISLRFFEPGPLFQWDLNDADVDKALIHLNAGSPDPEMIGKAVPPDQTPLLTVWVRDGLSPALTGVTVLHGARHIWNSGKRTDLNEADEEQEAFDYGWCAGLKVFPDEEVRLAVAEYQER